VVIASAAITDLDGQVLVAAGLALVGRRSSRLVLKSSVVSVVREKQVGDLGGDGWLAWPSSRR
jgi:hypothetical protein